jgi:hypothetical protein
VFELANKAETNARQQVHFDAMRDIRLRRAGLETAFRARFLDRFERRGPAGRDRAEEAGSGRLGLVDNDELELTIAVTSMVSKARALCEDEVYALDRRIGQLLGEPDLEAARNPLGPESVCLVFRQACDGLEADVATRLLILKLFDRNLAAGLPPLYRAINQYLIAHDVLPHLRRPLLVRPGASAVRPASPPVRPPAGPGVQGRLEPDVVEFLQEIATAARPGQSFLLGSTLAAGPGGVAQDQVLATLGQIQAGQVPAAWGVALDPGLVATGTVNVLQALRAGGIGHQMAPIDELMLELVTLIFDYILDDTGIPAAFKALIGRLQIPMLRVAILDKALFARKAHPARRLLDALAEAALGWTDGASGSDELIGVVERVVHRVLTEFDRNVELFDELLGELQAAVAGLEQRAQQRAAVSAKVIQGRERLEQAKQAANSVVDRTLADEGVPIAVRDFVDRHWRSLLVVTHNRQGADSPLWRERVEMLHMLLWSVTPKRSGKERRLLLTALPTLVRSLGDTLRAVGMADDERELFLAALAECHSAALKARHSPTPSADEQTAPDGEPPTEPHGPREGPAAGPPGEAPGREVEEIVLATRHPPERPVGDAPSPPEDDPHLQAVRELGLGAWVEFQGDGGTRGRARLTWISDVTGLLLFTDRRGLKVTERTPAGLAADFRRGTARVLETVPLFDRALTHLMDGLRRSPAATT